MAGFSERDCGMVALSGGCRLGGGRDLAITGQAPRACGFNAGLGSFAQILMFESSRKLGLFAGKCLLGCGFLVARHVVSFVTGMGGHGR